MDVYPDYYTPELLAEISRRTASCLDDDKTRSILNELKGFEFFMQRCVVDLDKEMYDIRKMRVAFALLRSVDLGAFSYSSIEGIHSEKFDFIGINLGTAAVLFDNFNKVLSSTTAFVGCGKWQKEDNERASRFLELKADVSEKLSFPHCPVRTEYARILTSIGLSFVVYHEATHLYKGHVDWLQANNKSPIFVKGFDGSIIPTNDLVRQFFEVDADDCALQLTWSVRPSVQRASALKGAPRAVQLANYYAFGTYERTVKTFAYSLYTIFRIADRRPWNDQIQKGSHPRALLRARYFINRFIEVLGWERPGHREKEYIIDLIWDAVKHVEQDLSNLIGLDSDIKTVIEVLKSPAASLHIQEINRIQHEIEPQLLRYRRGTKFPGTPLMKSAM